VSGSAIAPPATGAAPTRQGTGRLGEDLAAAYLSRAGMQVVERGYRCRQGEIDLVARDGDDLVFVEVRTRRSATFGTPEESLTARKQRTMVACALAYLGQHNMPERAWRLDFVAIVLAGRRVARLDHYKHVFG
jgi:putative endonuclease